MADVHRRDEVHGMRQVTARSRIAALLLWAVAGSGLGGTPTQSPEPPAAADDPGLELRVAGATAAVLDRVSKTVIRFTLTPPRTRQAASFRAERLAVRPEVVAGAPQVLAPTAIAIDPVGRIFIADASGPVIHVVETDGTLSTFYKGPALSYPIGLVVGNNGRLYVLDGALRAILSLQGPNAVPVEEFQLDRAATASEAQTLFWRAGTMWAVTPGTGSVLRLFASATSTPSMRSLRGGETIQLRHIFENGVGPGAIGVGHDGLFALDRATKKIKALSLADGTTLGIDYTPFIANPVAIALTDDALFFLGKDAASLVRIPMLSQVTAYFEAGQPSENAVQFYEYLVDRRIMPFRKYTLQKGDEIRRLVTDANLLPSGPTESFETLFCRFNQRFCAGDKYPKLYFPGQEITLPDIAVSRYVGRVAVRLPVDVTKFPILAQQAIKTVADVTRTLAPLTWQQPDTLRSILRDLNYTFGARDLLTQTEGNFIVPVDAARFRALVPQRDLADPKSALSLLASKNMKLVPTTPASAGEQSVSVEGGQAVALPPAVVPEPDDRCQPVDPKPYTRVQKLISFCLPKILSPVTMAIIDARFDFSHEEFKDSSGSSSRLMGIGIDNGNVERKPISDDQFDNFDLKIDHGTHVAGLLAARNAKSQVAGLVPTMQLYAATAAKAKDLFDTMRLNICNISLGDKGKKTVGVPTDITLLYDLISNPAYGNVLFVVSAGNDGEVPPKDTLASLAARSNVIVVGASSWDPLPTISPYSNYDFRYVHIAAPGNMIKSTTFGGGYGVATGTSQATALVSGTAALLRATAGATWAPWQLKERLLSTADLWLYRNGESGKVFSGMLNMKRALFDAGYGVFTKYADSSIIKGTIAPDDAERKISVTPIDKDGPGAAAIRYGDIRRFKRNGDGTYTILYSTQSDKKDPLTRALERLLNVQAGQVAPVAQTETLSFKVVKLDGTTVVVQLFDLEDFWNAVF